MSQIKIIKQNKNYLALYKPIGWTVYAEAGSDDNCLDFLEKRFGSKFFPVHRLDKATCGVVLFGKTSAAASRLSQVLQTKKTKKKYIALVHGPLPSQGRFTNPLAKKGESSKNALTDFRKLESYNIEQNEYTLCELLPQTGRFHQLRRHLSMNGFPILGDPLYEKGKKNNFFNLLHEKPRLLLSAVEIIFLDPWERKEVKIQSEAGFLPILKSIRRTYVHH